METNKEALKSKLKFSVESLMSVCPAIKTNSVIKISGHVCPSNRERNSSLISPPDLDDSLKPDQECDDMHSNYKKNQINIKNSYNHSNWIYYSNHHQSFSNLLPQINHDFNPNPCFQSRQDYLRSHNQFYELLGEQFL